MEIRLLGPLEALDAGAPFALGGTKQRAVLAALALAGGRVVSAARLVDDLWGVRPPNTAPKMVQIHVSALRKVLPSGVLVTRAPGYAVDLPRDAVDAFRAEDALRAGRESLAGGDPRRAADLLGEALSMWRGPALAEFTEPFAEAESRRLEELRLALTEERLAADLALGRHGDVIREAEALVAREPLRERLRELQMLALYRAGRQAEALAVYQEARHTLSEELGIEPSARLRELERAVLQQDVALDAAPPPAAAARTYAVPAPGGVPIGRGPELAALRSALAAAAAGAVQVVLVTGEAGAGKTTLLDAFLAGLGDDEATVGRGQCVDQHGPSEAYMPVLQALERLCRAPGAGGAPALLVERAPTWVVQLPWLLDRAGREALGSRLVGANRDRMLREGVEALTELSRERPVILAIEDLQWSDLATLDLLAALARHREAARLMLIATMRSPETATRDDAIRAAAEDLVARGLAIEVPASAFGEEEVARFIAARLPGADPPDGLAASLLARTGGMPLFLEKAVEGWMADGRAVLDDGGWRLSGDAATLSRDIPSTLRGLIRRRLDPLPAEDRRALETASVAAPAFSAALVAAGLGEAEADVEERLDALARAGVMLAAAGEERWPDGTVAGRYAFTHDLCHEVIYDDLPPGRRARLHLAVGDRLEHAHARDEDGPAAELAVHFLRAGEPARAVRHLVAAAERAARRLAPREALALAEQALEAIRDLPSPEREPMELRTALLHGLAVIATSGWGAPEAERSFERARELAHSLGRPEDVAWATYRLATLHEVRGAYDRSEELLQPLLAPDGRPLEQRLALDLDELMACTLFHQGRFGDSLERAEHGLAIERAPVNMFLAAAGDDPVTACHHWAALSIWHLGRPETAREVSERAIALVDAPGRRHAAASALALGAVVAQCANDPTRTRDLASRAVAEAEARGYVYRVAMGRVLLGWARAALGDTAEGIAELREGVLQSRATGARMDEAYYLGLLADAHLRAGDPAAARAALDEAREVIPRDGRFFHEPELHRLRGEVARRDGDLEAAERAMRTARDVAREQGALLPELRAALGLGSVLRATGRPTEARAAVAEVLGRFTEGFSSPDLRAASAFLAAGDVPPAELAPPVRYARSGELSIAYEVTGDGPRDLVLVPGFISHLEQDRREPRHARFLDRLAELGRLIRFDKRGTGLSDRPPGVPDLEARMDDVRAVMDAAGSRRAVLVGYSEGCPMSILFAATYPERVAGVVLIGGFAKRIDPDEDYPWAPTREEREAHVASLLGDGGLERMMRLMCPSADDAMARWWGERCRAAASPGAIRALAEMNSLIDVRGVLPAVQAPTLVLHRTADADVRVEEGRYLASRIPGATMVELAGADHFVAIGADQLVNAIAPFVAGLGDAVAAAPEEAVATVVAAADGGAPLIQIYEGPVRAVREAVALARRLGRGVGVHTGPVRRAGGPAGDAVRIAAAVASVAPPGEALVTITSRDLVPGSGLTFDRRGELAGDGGPRPLFAAIAPAPD